MKRSISKNSALRSLVVVVVKAVKQGETVRTRGLYSKVYARFPRECESLGFTASKPVEEKWLKDIRWGLQDARSQGLIEHIGSEKSGLWRRL
jgi:hypothetical protein